MRVSSSFVFLLFAATLHLDLAVSSYLETAPIRIDCGNTKGDFFDPTTNLTWSKDVYYQGGITNTISETNNAGGQLGQVDQTLRSWTTGDSCYEIPVPVGRYFVQLSFAYNNYDQNYYISYQSNSLPSVGVIIQNYFVEEVGGFKFNSSAYYTDYLVFVNSDTLTICFAPFNQQPPFVNSIQVLPADPFTLYAGNTGNASLSNWKRINSGGDTFGDGNDISLYRSWMADVRDEGDDWRTINSSAPIEIPGAYQYNHLPEQLFNTCREAIGDHTGYNFTNIHPVNPSNSFLVVLYFVEYNDTLAIGDRNMSIWVNGVTSNIDLLESVGAFQAKMWIEQVPLGGDPTSAAGGWISVIVSKDENATMPPVLCGVEVYEVIDELLSENNTKTNTDIRIDCGTKGNYTDDFGALWTGDFGYSSGNSSVAIGGNSTLVQAQTLRYFPYPKQNCYMIPVSLESQDSTPKFMVRMLFNSGNYNGSTNVRIPYFNVSVQGTVVTDVYPVPPGYFIDAITYVENEVVEVCLLGKQDGPPTIINALEIFEVNSGMYTQVVSGSDVILYNYYRLNCGGDTVGDDYTDDVDSGHRQWSSDLSTLGVDIAFPDETSPTRYFEENLKYSPEAPNYFPSIIYETARVSSKGQIEGGFRTLTYTFENLHNGSDILLVLHFAELFAKINAGERVFDVDVIFYNDTELNVVRDLDLAKEVGPLVPKVTMTRFSIPQDRNYFQVRFSKSNDSDAVYDPIVNAIEVYRIVMANPLTVSSQATYMIALRDSLNVGHNLNWQGDPCSPQPWFGVTCVQSLDGSKSYSIESIDLSGQSLVGTIADNIATLTQLKFLNLSNNQITGSIPNGLAEIDIEQIDLSRNQISGSIPAKLGQNANLRLLNLSSLSLSGTIPETSSNSNLQIDLSNNPYLCGSPGLPACPSVSQSPSGSPQTILPPPTSTQSKGGKSSVPVGALVGAIIAILILGSLIFAAVYYYRRRGYSQTASSELPTPSNRNPYWRVP